MRCSSSWRLVIFSLLAIAVGSQFLAVAQEQTVIGSTMTNCAAPTFVGTTQCSDRLVKPAPLPVVAPKRVMPPKSAVEPRDSASDPVVGGVKESEVNEFLANYGKPSRQAVRALLNPSDENIASMLKVEKSQLAVAAYTAQRRVELSQQSGASANELSQADLPALIGMRLTVLVAADCKGCEKVLPFVNQLVTEFPSVDARIGVLGLGDPKEFVIKAAELGVYLPVSKVSVERMRQLRLDTLPAILIGDTRYQGDPAVIGSISSALDLERAVVQVRRANEKKHATSATSNAKGNIND